MEIWPSDLDYGILGFDFPKSIGGKIKTQPEDFVVTEVDSNTNRPIPIPPREMYEHGDGGGLYLVGRLWKRNTDHAKMKRLLSKTFRVPENNISTAGIKDKKAVTTQLFSVYQPGKKVNDPTAIDENIEVDSFRYYRERMYPGRMAGNAFDITIREANVAQDILDEFGEFVENGMLNYYGYQRFGGNRPITAEFGRFILQKKYHDAVQLYLGGKSAGVDEIYREMWRDNQDPSELLINWDNIPMIEKDLLLYLSKKPNDYYGAIRKIPEFLINLSQSSFISLLFNNYISMRGDEIKPLQGEREFNQSLTGIVTNKEVTNIEIATPSNKWEKPLNDIWKSVFDKFGIENKELKSVTHNSRSLKSYIIDYEGMEMDSSTAQVSFQLGTGEYATTVLRELMQVKPVNLC